MDYIMSSFSRYTCNNNNCEIYSGKKYQTDTHTPPPCNKSDHVKANSNNNVDEYILYYDDDDDK
jgi:hypothetical protein